MCVIRNGRAGLRAVPQSGDADGLAQSVPASIQAVHQENRGGQPARAGDALCTGQQVCSGEEEYVGTHSQTVTHYLLHTHSVSHYFNLIFLSLGFSLLLGFLGAHPGQILLHRLWLPRVSRCVSVLKIQRCVLTLHMILQKWWVRLCVWRESVSMG